MFYSKEATPYFFFARINIVLSIINDISLHPILDADCQSNRMAG